MASLTQRAAGMPMKRRVITKRQEVVVPGYTTTDDFGTDGMYKTNLRNVILKTQTNMLKSIGDDTPHSSIPNYYVSNDLQANANFPATGDPETVDLIFLDFITSYVIGALAQVGINYTTSDVDYYLNPAFTTNSYLPAYAQLAWANGTC